MTKNKLGSINIDKKARALLTFLQSEEISLLDCLKVIKQIELLIKNDPNYITDKNICFNCQGTGLMSNPDNHDLDNPTIPCMCTWKEIA